MPEISEPTGIDSDVNLPFDSETIPATESAFQAKRRQKSPLARIKSERPPMDDRQAKSTMPTVDEYMHFFGDILIRLSTDYYIELVFRGVDESALTDREIEKISLTKDERDRIARPFAEFSYKNPYMRKHGRSVIALGDGIDAMFQLGIWLSRVNRIAASHRNGVKPKRHQRYNAPKDTVYIPAASRSVNEERVTVVSSQPNTEAAGSRANRSRPPIVGTVFHNGNG